MTTKKTSAREPLPITARVSELELDSIYLNEVAGPAIDEFQKRDKEARSTIAAQKAQLDELRASATAALGWIDEIYPPDIFDGSSGDEGPVRVVVIRENLRRALQDFGVGPPLRSDDDESSAGQAPKELQP